ncbi:hypothetical protein FW774_04170 (plasmid) [Pedobacter sp. BS3]|uniref:hypothetical protein n=1 Tax=Pedobacter sp. BS3 TaxID=2567937 RepID=UPI0011EBEC28|nr:hypothetical protein [Pedobacter sp. BS3]TZF86250.1 hypothetical protein FW774_04170 [Pedobacter sp. BS3]
MKIKLLIISFFWLCFVLACKKDTDTTKAELDAPVLEGYEAREIITCEGTYPMHLQGIARDENNMFWCYTNQLVKTDMHGKVLKKIDVPYHHGDLTVVSGKVYVAVGFGTWNNINGLADSWVYVYDAGTLERLSTYHIPEVIYGAGGIVKRGDSFYVVGGLPEEIFENYVYEYDSDFNFKKRYIVESGYTSLGIQTIDYHGGEFWVGCYGNIGLIRLTNDFKIAGWGPFDASIGIASISDSELLIGKDSGNDNLGYAGEAIDYIKK